MKDILRYVYLFVNRIFNTNFFFKFKIAHIRETNHCFIHILANQVRLKDGSYETKDYDLFNKFDLTMQLYFSDHQNRHCLSKISMKKLYAFKDVETTIFKRLLKLLFT